MKSIGCCVFLAIWFSAGTTLVNRVVLIIINDPPNMGEMPENRRLDPSLLNISAMACVTLDRISTNLGRYATSCSRILATFSVIGARKAAPTPAAKDRIWERLRSMRPACATWLAMAGPTTMPSRNFCMVMAISFVMSASWMAGLNSRKSSAADMMNWCSFITES